MSSPPEPADMTPVQADDSTRPLAFTVAALICVAQALVLVAIAVFYGVALLRGEGSNATTVAMSAVLILVFAALLLVPAGVWWRGSTRAAVPTLVWNGVLVPVVFALYAAGDPLVATALLVLVLAGLVAALAALATSRTAT
ncbi:MAG: hypothetical protein M3Z83_09155 [Actinomycetota bacterium]|nr:hypothetical protein [Actinomycetota bacterium]